MLLNMSESVLIVGLEANIIAKMQNSNADVFMQCIVLCSFPNRQFFTAFGIYLLDLR